MKKTAHRLLLATAILALAACRSSIPQVYIADAPRDQKTPITNTYGSTLYPGDLLHIYVHSRTPESTIPFNEETNKRAIPHTSDNPVNGYLIQQNGEIIFPILGPIPAAGLTIQTLSDTIEQRLRNGLFVTDPTVTINRRNFHVTVIGEVAKPNLVHSDGDRLTLFEALAVCGDVTSNGLRNNVVIVRQKNDRLLVDTIDLTRREFLNSPYYYLQQNDIVYVEPTPKRRRQAYRDEDWPQYITTGIAALRIAYRLIYRIRSNN